MLGPSGESKPQLVLRLARLQDCPGAVAQDSGQDLVCNIQDNKWPPVVGAQNVARLGNHGVEQLAPVAGEGARVHDMIQARDQGG
eukprot:1559024-Pyramimonas_sp.AAC.1